MLRIPTRSLLPPKKLDAIVPYDAAALAQLERTLCLAALPLRLASPEGADPRCDGRV